MGCYNTEQLRIDYYYGLYCIITVYHKGGIMTTLAKYIADYIDHEIDRGGYNYEPAKNMYDLFHKWIIEALDAYESTEDCKIVINRGK